VFIAQRHLGLEAVPCRLVLSQTPMLNERLGLHVLPNQLGRPQTHAALRMRFDVLTVECVAVARVTLELNGVQRMGPQRLKVRQGTIAYRPVRRTGTSKSEGVLKAAILVVVIAHTSLVCGYTLGCCGLEIAVQFLIRLHRGNFYA
jgi:hypothetical protein